MTDTQLSEISAGSGGSGAATEAATEAAEEATGKDTGEWLVEIFDRLDERGLVEPMLFGPDSNINETSPDVEADHDGDGMELNAEAVADIGKTVIDTMGDVPISQVVKFAENNPEQVNRLINQKLGEDDGD